MSGAPPSKRARAVLGATMAIFLALIGVLLVSSVTRPAVHAFTPRVPHSRSPVAADAETVTVDARDARAWRYLDLDNGARESSPFEGWDLAVRRFDVISSGVVADLGAVPFASVTRAPSPEPSARWIATRRASDTTNAALRRWYGYSFLSHVLESRGNVYVVRTSADAYVKMRIVSYYCPGPTAGCMTMVFSPVAAFR